MPTRDRHWRAQMVVGLGLITLAIIAAAILWSIQLMTFQLSDFLDPYLRTQAISAIVQILLLVGSLLLVGAESWRGGLRARTRYRMRVAAMNGQPDAMPLVRPDIARGAPADAPDLRGAPLSLTWRATTIARIVTIPLFGFFVAVFLGIAGVLVYLLMMVATTPAVSSVWLGAQLLIYGFLVILCAGCVSLAGLLVVFMSQLFRVQGITATDDGITYYPPYGRSRLLRWEDMRLLELAMPTRNSSSNPNTYILHGVNAAAEWSEPTYKNAFATYGATNDELERRQQALLDLIAARTGLQPRSCDRELWENYSAPQRKARNNLMGCALFFGLLLFLVAGLIVFGGLTSSPLLNDLVAGDLIALFIGVVITSLRSEARLKRARDESVRVAPIGLAFLATDPPRESSSSAIPDRTTTYAIVYGSTVFSRLRFSAWGLSLLVCAAPAISGALAFLLALPVIATTATNTSALSTLRTLSLPVVNGGAGVVASILLLPAGAGGLLALFSAVRSSRTLIVADADGLRWRRRGQTRRLALREIVSVEARLIAGQLLNYTVTNSGASVSITWLADALAVRPLTPRDLRRMGASAQPVQPIMPRALATLVQERSGVALTHGEMTASGWSGRRA